MRKKISGLIVLAIAVSACTSGSNSEESASTATGPATDTVQTAPAGEFEKGRMLISQSDCIGCHKDNEKILGPAYSDVAAKYKDTPENVALLSGKVISGGQGVWGAVPMTPHPSISKADAAEMVKYILSLK